jgi:hypothetical protein
MLHIRVTAQETVAGHLLRRDGPYLKMGIAYRSQPHRDLKSLTRDVVL